MHGRNLARYGAAVSTVLGFVLALYNSANNELTTRIAGALPSDVTLVQRPVK